MCGICGFYAADIDVTQEHYLEALDYWADGMEDMQVRGTDATGGYSLADGELRTFKRPGAAPEFLDDVVPQLAAARSLRPIVIGHTRHATQGDPADNRNNHPFVHGHIAGVHNGVYRDYAAAALGLPQLRGGCDSEAIFAQLAARRSEQHYLNVLDAMNAFNRVVFWDAAASHLYGYSGDIAGLWLAEDRRLGVVWVASGPQFMPAHVRAEAWQLAARTLYILTARDERCCGLTSAAADCCEVPE